MQRYVVASGDNLRRIARRHGLGSWRDIYYHPRNAGFRARRPNPAQIQPGDELMVPGPNEVMRWRKRSRRPRPTQVNRDRADAELAARQARRSAA